MMHTEKTRNYYKTADVLSGIDIDTHDPIDTQNNWRDSIDSLCAIKLNSDNNSDFLKMIKKRDFIKFNSITTDEFGGEMLTPEKNPFVEYIYIDMLSDEYLYPVCKNLADMTLGELKKSCKLIYFLVEKK